MTHKPLILSNDEIVEIITVQECMDIVEKLFGNLEDSQMPPKIYLDIPDGDFRAMPAIVGNTAGIKWCGVHLDKTRKKRKINIFAKVLINDVDSGKLLAIMDGEKITAIRTAAVTGIATKYLAKKDASIASFIGCGNQTLYQIQAICHARKIKQIRLFDFDYTRCNILKTHFFEDYDVVICDDGEECIRDGDIITTLTPSIHGFVKYDWLKSSVHINAIGADAKGKRELDLSVLNGMSLVVYDNWEQCSHSGEIQYVDYKDREQPWVSLGDIVSGKEEVRGDQILFDATGLAVEDVVTARYIYEKVK